MVQKYYPHIIVIFLALFITFGCDEYATGPNIEWTSGGETLTYSYSGGVRTGANLYKSFNVVDDESGEIKIKAKIGSKTESCVAYVEGNSKHKVIVSLGIGEEGSSSKVILDSPSANNSYSINITGYSVSLKSVNIQ